MGIYEKQNYVLKRTCIFYIIQVSVRHFGVGIFC